MPASTTRGALDAEMAADPTVRARVDAIVRSDDEIRRRYSARDLVGVRAARPRSARGLTLAIALATAVAAILAVTPHLPSPTDRIKGSAIDRPALAVYRRTPAGSERLADGDVARAGDLLRVGYQPAGRDYGVILSIDGRGAVTRCTCRPPARGRRHSRRRR